jgi:8-oxo-dGTP pyrophosphatase MutT (NUDIX family)
MTNAIETQAKTELRKRPALRPRDAASLILIDRTGPSPKVLMGRRHKRHIFMPGKFVFPGGRVEPEDARMPVTAGLAPEHEIRLLKQMRRPIAARARAFALAAIRETCEETGLVLGRKRADPPKVPSESWRVFADLSVTPDLSPLHFVARAITPPGNTRRFDARFFMADAELIAHRIEGVVGVDSELDELVWIPIAEARDLNLSGITQRMLDEAARRLSSGLDPALPVPFYRVLRRQRTRQDL